MPVSLAYLGIILIWTTTPLAIKWSGEEVGFLFGIIMRMAIAFVICLAIVMIWYRSLPFDRRALHVYLAVGLPLYIGMLAVYWGAQYLSSGIISVIFGLVPFFTGIFAAIWLKERSFSVARVVGLMFGLLGLAIVFYKSLYADSVMLLGILAILIGAVMHAAGTVWVKNVATEFSSLTANTGGLIVAIFLFGLTWLLGDSTLPEVIPDYVGASILYLGVFGSVFGAILFYFTLKHVDANTMGLLPLITPVTALLLGHFFNNEVVEFETMIGTATIIFGLVIYQWSYRFVALFERIR